jgi:anti-sigma-K factor RskA
MSDMQPDHEEVKELVAAYVLGALPEEEMPFVRAHILSCDECMAVADGYTEVVTKLALTADPVDLPDGFEDRVLASAGRGDETATSVPAERNRWVRVAGLGAAAAVVAAGVLGYSLIDTRRELDEARSDISGYQDVLSDVLHNGDAGLELAGAGAVGRMIPSGDGSVFVLAGLHRAPENHTYQLWLLDGDEPVSAGIFDVSNGVALLRSEHSPAGFSGAAVTIEPRGGSPAPTTEPILSTT